MVSVECVYPVINGLSHQQAIWSSIKWMGIISLMMDCNVDSRSGSQDWRNSPRHMYAKNTTSRNLKEWNDLGSRLKAILLSSASLANMRCEMEEAQGQCFADK